MRLLGVIVVLLVLAIGGLAGYAYLGDMKADPKEMRIPVELDLGAGAPAAAPAAPAADAPASSDSGAAPASGAASPQTQANDID